MKSIVKNLFVGLFIAAYFLFASSPTVLAQGVVARSGDVADNVGSSSLTGVDGNKHVNFGFSGGYNLTDKITVLGEYSYLPMGSVSASEGGFSAHLQQLGGAVRFNFLSSKRVVPYAVAGFGYARSSSEDGITLGPDIANGNGFYLPFGGGASIYLGHHWGIRPEFRNEFQAFYSVPLRGWRGEYVALGTTSVFYQWGGRGMKK